MSYIIELKHLGKTFSSKEHTVVALEDINVGIHRGEIFGIIGLSGAGKSTLVRCINFLERPTEGNVVFDGRQLKDLSTKELLKARQSMGMIFQGFNLLSQRSVLKNICYPLEIAGVNKKKARIRALELLKLVGLLEKQDAYPFQLSGGQMQRVAIARALATNPKVLLCDEATSALDPNTTRSILKLLKDINHKLGVTIIVITHEMSVIEQICHRVAVIDQSHIVELGDVREVFQNPKSDIAKNLILPRTLLSDKVNGKKCIRIIFDGNSSFEPIVSNLTLECQASVNIMYANTKDIDGKAYGEMLIQLPDSHEILEKVKNYLHSKKIFFKEEELDADEGTY